MNTMSEMLVGRHWETQTYLGHIIDVPVEQHLPLALLLLLPHPPEIIHRVQTLREPVQSVDERYYLGARQQVVVDRGVQGGLVELEEDLESGADAGRLDFTPEAAFVTADAVHDSGDVTEVLLEFFFEDLNGTLVNCVRTVVGTKCPSGGGKHTCALSPRNRTVSSNLPTFCAVEIRFFSFSRVYASPSCEPSPQ